MIVNSYFIPVCSMVKLLPLGTVDDLMHYCTWRSAIVHQFVHDGQVQLCIRSSLVLRGNNVTILQTDMK